MPPTPPNRNGAQRAKPMTPPPPHIPARPAQSRMGTMRVSPGSIRGCMGRFTYIWMSNGQEFWMFPIQLWGDTVAGFRWDRRFGWSYVGISLNRIDMFSCAG